MATSNTYRKEKCCPLTAASWVATQIYFQVYNLDHKRCWIPIDPTESLEEAWMLSIMEELSTVVPQEIVHAQMPYCQYLIQLYLSRMKKRLKKQTNRFMQNFPPIPSTQS